MDDDNEVIRRVDGRLMGRRPRPHGGGNPGDVTPRYLWRVAGGALGMLAEEDARPGDPGYGECRHKPWHRYSRFPCVCNRTLWPRRGQGRGESPTSRRRLAAKARAAQALELRMAGMTWDDIARRLAYAGKSGVHAAVLRLYEDDERGAGEPHWRQEAHQRLDDLTRRKRGWPTLDEARAYYSQ